MKQKEKMILICSNCKTQICAEGILFCEDYKTSGFEEVTEKEYQEMSKTNPYLKSVEQIQGHKRIS